MSFSGWTRSILKLTLPIMVISAAASFCAAQWVKQEINTDASFRGLSVVNANVVWASGTKGTFIKTVDGGKTWQVGTVPGAERKDFRDIEAFDADMAYLMAAGEGVDSRIYKTTDGGVNWTLQFQNEDPDAFLDGIAFWDAQHGMAVSDPVKVIFLLLRTDDGGTTWDPLPEAQRPQANEHETAFAASGTCLVTKGTKDIWLATGGPTARVFHSSDRGRQWTVATTGLRERQNSTGNFSLAFRDRLHGVVVGGDYRKPDVALFNAATTADGGRTWQLVTKDLPFGFRSCVAVVPGAPLPWYVTVGTSGADTSMDGGRTWHFFGTDNFNSVAFADMLVGYAVGPNGLVSKLTGTRSGSKRKQVRR